MRYRVVPSSQAGYGPGKHQAQYRDPIYGIWFDIGEPSSFEEAQRKIRDHEEVNE